METEARNKQPKLTLMEEILLMGLKDKQVRNDSDFIPLMRSHCRKLLGLPFVLER